MRARAPHAVLCVVALMTSAGCEDALPRTLPVEVSVDDPCRHYDCGGYGLCAASAEGTPECHCDVGYQGPNCDVCASSFHRTSTDVCAPDATCAELDENPCAPHGDCVDEVGVIACACDVGYEGPRCTLCADGYARHDDDGLCLLRTAGAGGLGAGDNPECARSYTGPLCTQCETGRHFVEDQCVVDEKCLDASCPRNATCALQRGLASCTCLPEYIGQNCFGCAPNHHSENDACVIDEICEEDSCPANASCRVVDGVVACPCEPGYVGETCDACDHGYHLEGETCVVDESCGENPCPTSATCAVVGGVVQCTCLSGYTGEGCAFCEPGFHTEGTACVRDEHCRADSCQDNALCDVVDGRVACTCVPGWGPEGDCDTCEDHVTDRTGFEFPSGWSKTPNQCRLRRELSVAQMTFESRLSDGMPRGHVHACAPNDFSKMTSQHIELEAYVDQPAVLTLDEPAVMITFDFGALLEPLDLEVRAERKPTVEVDADGGSTRRFDPEAPVVETIALGAASSGTFTVVFDTPMRVLTVWTRNDKLQKFAIDNVLHTYPQCD